MKILVIPDIHLKADMFVKAKKLLKKGIADKAVCLMDIADDWHKQFQIDDYAKAYDAAIEFAIDFPDTLWCYGNHDLCYLWNERETGYSNYACKTVVSMLGYLNDILIDIGNPIKYVQKVDNILFSHGGITDSFVKGYVDAEKYSDTSAVVDIINSLGHYEMWEDDSPIWARPQNNISNIYSEGNVLQVVGHTPVREIYRINNLISCDTFSTYNNGEPIGTQEFLLIDTNTWEYKGVK